MPLLSRFKKKKCFCDFLLYGRQLHKQLIFTCCKKHFDLSGKIAPFGAGERRLKLHFLKSAGQALRNAYYKKSQIYAQVTDPCVQRWSVFKVF